MNISENGKNIIKSFEGCKLTTYLCSAGVKTIGFGSTIINHKPVVEGQKITLEEANKAFDSDILVFQNNVLKHIKKPLNQNQFDAIISFVYNVGVGNFKSSTLLKKLNINPNDPTIKDEFLKWNKAAGKVVIGLTNRRVKEAELYFK